jgi:hypothetical protein
LSTIDATNVKYVCVKLNDSEWPEAISIIDAATSAAWDINVWIVTIDDANNKLNIKFA